MWEERLARFSRGRLKGRPVPDDLRAMLVATWEGRADPEEEWGLAFLEPDESPSVVFSGHLDDEARADPGTMANVAAHRQTHQHIGVVAAGEGGLRLFWGYWLHPSEPADRPPRIVICDTEGFYEVLGGCGTLAEAIASDDGEEIFDERTERFEELGIPFGPYRWEDLEALREADPGTVVSPQELHRESYRAELVRRGRVPGGPPEPAR